MHYTLNMTRPDGNMVVLSLKAQDERHAIGIAERIVDAKADEIDPATTVEIMNNNGRPVCEPSTVHRITARTRH